MYLKTLALYVPKNICIRTDIHTYIPKLMQLSIIIGRLERNQSESNNKRMYWDLVSLNNNLKRLQRYSALM